MHCQEKIQCSFLLTGIWIWILLAFSSGLADENIYIGRYENYQLFRGQTEPGYSLLMSTFSNAGVPFQTYKMIILHLN